MNPGKLLRTGLCLVSAAVTLALFTVAVWAFGVMVAAWEVGR